MSDTVILAEGLSKRYRIQQGLRAPYSTLRDSLAGVVKSLFHVRFFSNSSGNDGYIWALKDVSFEVKRGEVVGIVGRNGAGKTTLLKILARITEPTRGFAYIHGRMGSLLEVGTGFHPELTGRENIYLNGAILGMRKAEIDRKFDEIVAFAEVSKFIDTPVKFYSSGMQVRLAFAVAAHLDPEILLVDEVLAVGDAAFQKRCLGKMGEVAAGGRTVLFVSHNMAAMLSLCYKGLLLEEGVLRLVDNINTVVAQYQSTVLTLNTTPLWERTDRRGTGELRFRRLAISGSPVSESSSNLVGCSGEALSLVLEYESPSGVPLKDVSLAITLLDSSGYRLFTCWTRDRGMDFEKLPPAGKVTCNIPVLPLTPGTYRLSVWSSVRGELADFVEDAAQLTVVEGDFYGTGRLPIARQHGPVLLQHSWSIEE